MFRNLGNSMFEQDAHQQRPLLMERSRLSTASASDATTIAINSLPRNAGANLGWVVIDPYTTEAECRKVSSRAGKILTLASGLTYAHAQFDDVLWLETPLLNVNWWGALGDASTDNTTAIQRAVNAACNTGLGLYIPAGTYITTQIVTTSGAATDKLHITGCGESSILKLKNSEVTNVIHVTTIDGISMRDLVIDGNVSGAASALTGIRIDIDDAYFNNVVFQNTVSDGLAHTPGTAAAKTRLIMEGCRFISCGGFGCSAQRITQLTFTGNIARDCGAGLIDVEPFHSGDVSYYINITGNSCYNTGNAIEAAGAIQAYSNYDTVGTNAIRFVTIANNVVHICGGIGIRVSNLAEATITGNIVSYADKHGIMVDGDTDGTIVRVSVTGNVVYSCSAQTANTWSGIYCEDMNQSVVVGNVISDINSKHKYHVYLDASSARNVIGANALGAAAAQTADVSINNVNNVYLPSALTPQALVAGDTTPSVSGGNFYTLANASPTTITDLDNGVEGQHVTIKFADGNTTITDGTNFQLSGGANFVSSADDTLSLVYCAAVWYETSRSVN